jgi:ATP-binding cassette subfamily B protein RaxB
MHVFDRLSLHLRRRVPVILQTEAAECGLACLAMIASYHGHRIDLASLRGRFAVSLKGTTLAALIEIAGRLELSTRPVRLELEDLRRLDRPCILHWNFNHFVVLENASSRNIAIHDPASGARALSLKEASNSFTGVALELWPNPRFETHEEQPRVRLRHLIGRVTGLHRSLGQVLLLAAVLEVFAITSPLFLQWVVDHALVSGSRDLLTLLAFGFGLLVLLDQSVTTLRSWVIMHFGTTLNVQWHANVFTHLLQLPMPYFDKRHLGDIVSRFRSIDVIQRTLTTAFIEAIVDGLMTVVIALLMFRYSVVLSLICVAAMTLYALGRTLAYRPLRLATEEQIVHAAKQESHFLETVRGVRTIKLFQRQDERRATWLALLIDQVNAGLRTQKLHILYRLMNGVLFGIENVLIIWLGARLVLDVQLSVGMLIAFISYKRQFSSRVGALIDKLFEVKMLRLQGERLADIVMTEREAQPHAGGRLVLHDNANLAPAIEIRGLRYRYAEHEAYVLDGIDLTVASGESVAIVGASGCGKSTLLHVLLGVLPPTEGLIFIGGVNLEHLGTEALRRTVASVTQNDTLFAGSIADNISFFDTRADQQHVEECARLAAIHAEIAAMPMGYNTFVGYMGSVLSGGQQQRLLLARALYKRPAILILDEATSHLDIKREIIVSAAIRALNITRVIVAHRPQTAATADRIVTLEAGRIARETRVTPNAAALRGAKLAPATQACVPQLPTQEIRI